MKELLQLKPKDILQAIRPKTLPIALSTVFWPCLIFWSNGGLNKVLLSFNILIVTTLIQIISNLANDWSDFKKGLDAERTGPERIMDSGKINHNEMRSLMIATVILTILLAIPLVMTGGWLILAIGLISLGMAFYYSFGERALAYSFKAELAAFLFFGPIASFGTLYLLTGHWQFVSLLSGAATGLYAVALLTVNNLRDYHVDLNFNRKNLVIYLGKETGFKIYYMSLILAQTCLCLTLPLPYFIIVTTLISFIAIVRIFTEKESYPKLFSTTIFLIIATIFLGSVTALFIRSAALLSGLG